MIAIWSHVQDSSTSGNPSPSALRFSFGMRFQNGVCIRDLKRLYLPTTFTPVTTNCLKMRSLVKNGSIVG